MVGEINVDAMLRRITAKQWRNWEMYLELEPMMRPDVQAASIAQMVFNMAVDVKDRKKLEEFLLQTSGEEKKRQTPEEQFAMLKVLAAMYAAPG